jgi:hypothetical protein
MATPRMQPDPDSPTHTPGVRKGEERSGKHHTGRKPVRAPRTMRDATGINARKREPIDPSMPELPPA